MKTRTMPIKGRINAQKSVHRVCTLLVGDRGYLIPEDICVTTKGILIDIDAEVLSKEELEQENHGNVLGFGDPNPSHYYVCIKRTGENLTEHDFELDFTNLSKNIIFGVHGPLRYWSMLRESIDLYIVFTDAEFNFEIQADEPVETRTLEEQLADAIEKSDYILAARIRDKIKEQGT